MSKNETKLIFDRSQVFARKQLDSHRDRAALPERRRTTIVGLTMANSKIRFARERIAEEYISVFHYLLPFFFFFYCAQKSNPRRSSSRLITRIPSSILFSRSLNSCARLTRGRLTERREQNKTKMPKGQNELYDKKRAPARNRWSLRAEPR